ncbi:MAG TPA: STAS domain-containing protein [Acidimicrobiales bacterium]
MAPDDNYPEKHMRELTTDTPASNETFSAVVSVAGHEATVAVSGEIDLATAPILRDVVLGVIESGECRTLVVDIGAVRFIDSTGLGVIVGANRRLADSGRRLLVAHPTSATRRVIEVSGLDRVLDIRS